MADEAKENVKPESVEAVELEDKDLDGVAGGAAASAVDDGANNCDCPIVINSCD